VDEGWRKNEATMEVQNGDAKQVQVQVQE